MKNSYLITGGTGSFGKSFLKKLLEKKNTGRIVIYSRDELKQSELQEMYPKSKYPYLRFFLGDVRDFERLKRAMIGVDFVIHAAALKQVPSTEYNPFEAVKTNILGAQNVINACFENTVKKVIALSTDKACAPINLYGATKLCSDKLFISANNIKGNKDIKFSVVRYGNVFGSRGSVYGIFKNFQNKGYFPITNSNMTRFNITLNQGIDVVLHAINNLFGGEIIIPKLKSFKILDLAKTMNRNNKIKIIGLRQGEKIHEQMISSSDSFNTLETKNFYIILPNNNSEVYKYYKVKLRAKKVKEGFEYSSDKNGKFLSVHDIKKIIVDEEKK
tara:strand:- start:8034 stop:9023 length:990 start_codon:yes stop_codon:yes gene_type:complete